MNTNTAAALAAAIRNADTLVLAYDLNPTDELAEAANKAHDLVTALTAQADQERADHARRNINPETLALVSANMD